MPHSEGVVPAWLVSLQKTVEWWQVAQFYGARRADRSRVPLINHILEGATVMHAMGASQQALRAFCLHPLLQRDYDLVCNIAAVSRAQSSINDGAYVLGLAMEYRSVANAYLAHTPRPPEGIRLSPLHEVNLMLVGDKVQNRKDFLAYHAATHPKRERLAQYFDDWLQALGVEERYDELVALLPTDTGQWRSPLPLALRPTADAKSFLDMGEGETGLPLPPHPGAFGVKRRFHTHEGVDLYCPEGTPVTAVEGGEVVAVSPFTGPIADMPWWKDTHVVLVEGRSGVVAYGEIKPCVKVGQLVQAGTLLGHVLRVLKTDKGRPTSMLHLELHVAGTRRCPEWVDERPASLRDPTPLLLEAAQAGPHSESKP